MAYKLSYTGQNIDSIFDKSRSFEAYDETWTIINKSDLLDISSLMRHGNYIFNGKLKLPQMSYLYKNILVPETIDTDEHNYIIFVREINYTIYQSISMLSLMPEVDSQTMCIVWSRQKDGTYKPYFYTTFEKYSTLFSISKNESTDTYYKKFYNQIRLFTDTNKFKYYDIKDSSYKEIITNVMSKDIYGIIDNAFATADNAINKILNKDNITNHMIDSNIHVSTEDKSVIDDKPILEELGLDELQVSMKLITEQIYNDTLKDPKENIDNRVSDISTSLNAHIQNATTHPSEDEINDWNSKAEKEHEHVIEDIAIDITNISGEFTSDQLELAKQRAIVVSSKDEILLLNPNNIKLHDWIIINDQSYPILYQVTGEFIINSETNEFSGLTQLTPDDFTDEELTWSNIDNKPSTIEELNVDYLSNSDVDDLINQFPVESVFNIIDGMNDLAKPLLLNKDYANSLETLIDIIDTKMKYIDSYIND